jgi:hypothetical protein
MNRVTAVLARYKEILILLAALGAVGASEPARRLVGADAAPQLEAKVDSLARSMDVLIKLTCLRERANWDLLTVAGIPCAKLVGVKP